MKNDVMTIFNENVRRVMKSKSPTWTIAFLAKKIGTHRETLSNILNGHSDTLMGTAKKIADALEVPLSELVDETPKGKGKKSREPQTAA